MVKVDKCNKCGSVKNLMIHHTHYKEIHGVEKTIFLCNHCHQLLHINLRKEGKCNIPPNDLYKIHTLSDSYKKKKADYKKENIFRKSYSIPIGDNISIRETTTYNKNTDKLKIISEFHSTKYNKKACRKYFNTRVFDECSVAQTITYNLESNNISVNSRFQNY